MNFSFQQHARFMGRFDLSEPETPVAGWVNSAVFLTFEGEEIRMTAESTGDTNYLEIVVDGIARNWFHVGREKREYIIAQDVPPGIHTLEIHKRTELLYGKILFHGFSLPKGGTFHAPPPQKSIRLEYFGDSITNGCGNGHPHELKEAPMLDDGYMSYVGISARLLQAEYHTIAISGIGMLQDAMGNINGLPPHFTGIHGHGSGEWDFSQYVADGVIINLGQNDFSNPINTDLFMETYIAFVRQIWHYYPNAFVFCCTGTMDNNYLPYVKQVVKTLKADNEKVHLVDLGIIHPEIEGLGGWFHPGFQTHYRMGVDLARYISNATGWSLLPRPATPLSTK